MKYNYQLILVPLLFVALEGKLPENFKRCRNDKHQNECLKIAIPDAMIKMANGLPELGAPPLEPLVVPRLTIEGNVVQSYTDMKIYNMTTAQYQKLDSKTTSEEFVADMELFIPEVTVLADYNFKGRLILLNIDGKGKSITKFKNTKVKVHLEAHTYQKKGASHFKLKELTYVLDPEKATFNFENIITGNPQLSEETNKSLNENWKEIFADVKPSYEEALGSVFKAYANNIFSRIDVNELATH